MTSSGSCGMTSSGSALQFHLVVAIARNRAMGQAGTMPWHIPEDLKNFQKQTSHFPIVMGRKTFQSLGRVLKNRPHFVVTSATDVEFQQIVSALPNPTGQSVVRCASLENVGSELERYFSERGIEPTQAFLIGGAQLYKQALELDAVRRMTLTEIDATFPSADTYFPEVDLSRFATLETSDWFLSVSGLRYRILTMHRKE